MTSRLITAWIRINGLVVTAISMAALCGHLQARPYLYNWGDTQFIGMALPTAVSFIGVGVSLWLVAGLSYREE